MVLYNWDREISYYNAISEEISKSAFRYTTGYSAEETIGVTNMLLVGRDGIGGAYGWNAHGRMRHRWCLWMECTWKDAMEGCNAFVDTINGSDDGSDGCDGSDGGD